MPAVQRVSHTHEAILQFMIANPAAPLGLVAAHFGYTQPWLSTLIHSDAFQAQLRRRQNEVFGEVVIAELKDKIVGAAHIAIDKLAEKVEVANDIRDVTDAAEMLLKSLGYGAPKAVPAQVSQTNVYNFADKETLARSRELMRRATLPEPVPPGEPLASEMAPRPDIVGVSATVIVIDE